MSSLRIAKDSQDQMYFVTLTVIEWINIFVKFEYFEVVINTLKYCQRSKGLELYAYVIMTNHIHVIAKASNGDLSRIVADFKRYTTRELLKILKYDIVR